MSERSPRFWEVFFEVYEPLPDGVWWDDFYTPMERRIEELRGRYGGDAEALGVLDHLAQEPEMHRRCSDYYAYEFFVTRRL